MNVLKIYNDTYWSLLNLNEDIYKKNEFKSHLKNFKVTEEEKNRISLSRSKRNIKEICLCNNFEYFITLTVSSKFDYFNRYDLEDCVEKVKKFMKAYKRKSKNFKYVYIIEQHDDKAYHFHGMCKGILETDIYKNKDGFYSSHFFDKFGRNSFDKIDDYNKCCNYITKYITKNCCRTENNQIYFCSRGLSKAREEFLLSEDLSSIFKNFYVGEFCQKKDFDISRLSTSEKLKLNAYFAKNDEFFQKDNNSITNWLKLFTNFDKYDSIHINQ